MQIRQSQIIWDRPHCAVDPKHKIHSHDSYTRFANCNDTALVVILRWLCVICGRTISVLPDTMLPFRPVPVPLLEMEFDSKASGKPPPPQTETEKGCLKRAWHRFSQRIAALTAVLGQTMQIRNRTAKLFWLQLRRLGNLSCILLQLARPFNTSLLHDYQCLRPWPARTD